MSQKSGLFVVLEGIDGSGKGTQFAKLQERLTDEGYDVAVFDFPRYSQPSSYFVREYLNGEYGTAEEVGPYTGSLFYALDRYQASAGIKEALAAGKVVIANRFTGSNMGHQGTKFDQPEERRGYYIWLDNLEFQLLGIPRPDKSIVLRVDAPRAQEMIDRKDVSTRSYTDEKRDIHEADLSHLERAVEVYDELCDLFPRDFSRIDCVREAQMMSIDAVQALVWQTIEPLLPAKQAKTLETSHGKAPVENPYIKKTANGGYRITSAGREWLKGAVSNIDSSVYATYPKLESMTAAAAMARLSRRGGDLRVTVLDEFSAVIDDESTRKDLALLQRVITAYGDDSVQQLVAQHMVVEDASNLLTKKLEWGRLASYLEQSTRYIYFDQKDNQGKYKYHSPEHFSDALKISYSQTMDSIFGAYSEIVHSLTDHVRQRSTVGLEEQDGAWKAATRAQACDVARAVLPVATTSTVGIFASGQALESLIMHLLADTLPEAQKVGNQLLIEARKVIGSFLERADKPDRGGANIAYMNQTKSGVKKLAQELLQESYGSESTAVTLKNYWPKNELDLVPHMLFEHSNMALHDLVKSVDSLSIEQKTEVFAAYIGDRLNRRHRPGRAIEHAHYTWDLVCDYGIFRDLQRHRMVDDLEWQALSPRLGYEVPEIIDEAGLTDQFEACFDASMKLYSTLQSAGHEQEAQYAVLFGHRMRWTVTYNAREAFHLHELRTSPQGHPGYRKLVQEMHEKLLEVHPLLGEAMKFVNQDEDPELARLAAERYTQFKLDQLD